jgi:hypothetical protein
MYGSHSGQPLFKPKKQDDLFQTLKKEFPDIKPEVLKLIIHQSKKCLNEVLRGLYLEYEFTPEKKYYDDKLLEGCRRSCANKESVAIYEAVLLEAKLKIAQAGLSASRP